MKLKVTAAKSNWDYGIRNPEMIFSDKSGVADVYCNSLVKGQEYKLGYQLNDMSLYDNDDVVEDDVAIPGGIWVTYLGMTANGWYEFKITDSRSNYNSLSFEYADDYISLGVVICPVTMGDD